MKHFERETSLAVSGKMRRVPLFVVLDLDRTLFDTDTFVEYIWRLLPGFAIGVQELEDLKAYEISQRGKQLDLIQEISRRFKGRLSIDELTARMADIGGEELLYRGVSELLVELKQNDVPTMIMTYGSQASQEMKLQLMRLSLGKGAEMPYSTIVTHQRKAAWLAEQCVQAQDGARVVPKELYDGKSIAAQQIVVVDDKKSNLEAPLAEGIGGMLIDNDGTSGAGAAVGIDQVSVAQLLRDVAT